MKKFMLRRLGIADDPGSAKPSLKGCLEAVLEQTDVMVEGIFSGLLSATLPPSVKGQTALLNTPLAKKAVEALMVQAETFKETFAVALRAEVYGGEGHRRREQPTVRFDDFQFLDEAQIEANIEFAMTQQEICRAVEDVTPRMHALVSSLMGFTTVQPNLNPLKPDSFVFALRHSMQVHMPSEAARAAIIPTAASLLGISLRQLYKDLSDWLHSQGIEPLALTGGLGLNPFGVQQKVAENPVTRTILTLDKLRKLLTGELEPTSMSSGADFNHTVPFSLVALEDMKLVEPMMKRLAKRASQSVQSTSKEPHKAEMVVGEDGKARPVKQSQQISQKLGEEVVRLMLENLLSDRRLLSKIRVSIKALEPVLLRLSYSDPRFFTDKQHPARLFLDRITHKSLAFTNDEDEGFARFTKAIDNAVSVLVGGEGDKKTFQRVLRKLEEGWARQEQVQRQRAEEAAKSLMHAEQRNMLAHRFVQEFDEKLLHKKVPDMVVSFLRGPWAQVAAEAQMRCADGTVDSDGYVALVDELIWSVQIKLVRRNRGRLVSMVPGMLVKLRQGLQLISYPEERMPGFFDALISIHEKAFEIAKSVGEAPTTTAAASASAEALAEEGIWLDSSQTAGAGYAGQTEDYSLDNEAEQAQAQTWTVEDLKTGSWVNLAMGGEWVRAQLTWASPHRTLFMFISGAGLAHSMSRRTLDRLHGLGLIHLISDGRVVEHALDAVAQAALLNDIGQSGKPKN